MMFLLTFLMGCLDQPHITGLDYNVKEDEVVLVWNTDGDFQHFSVFLDNRLITSTTDTTATIRVSSPGDYNVKLVGYGPGDRVLDERLIQVHVSDAPCTPSFTITPSRNINGTLVVSDNHVEFQSSRCKLYIHNVPNPPGLIYLPDGRYDVQVMCNGPFGKMCGEDLSIMVDTQPPRLVVNRSIYAAVNRVFILQLAVDDVSPVSCVLHQGNKNITFGNKGLSVTLTGVLPKETITIDCTDILGRKSHTEIQVR